MSLHACIEEDRKIHVKPEGFTLNKDDVWGAYNVETRQRISDGMIVARSEEICPIFGDKVPNKSVTVVCNQKQYDEVVYWLAYVHGGEASRDRLLEDGRIALRSDYQCW